MHHGVSDFDARRKAVEDEPSYFVFENRNQIGKLVQILFRAVNRRRQVAFEAASNRQNLIVARVPDQ